jgi:Protein of unknown function (DUF2637)
VSAEPPPCVGVPLTVSPQPVPRPSVEPAADRPGLPRMRRFASVHATQGNHRRAVRFFWSLLIGVTMVSLTGNITHAALSYILRIVIQVGAAAVPPIALLAAVHGIALAVGAGASVTVYRGAVSATAAIGAGAFAVSFLALRDLMRVIEYSSATAWIFPAIIDTAVAVSTIMLVALGDKPARRAHTVAAPASAQVKAGVPTAPAPVSAHPRPHSVRADQVASSAESAPDQRADAGPITPHLHPDGLCEPTFRATLRPEAGPRAPYQRITSRS